MDQLVGADGLEKLVLFVENREFMDIHTHALETLARCLMNEGILTQFHESGQMSRLVIGKRQKFQKVTVRIEFLTEYKAIKSNIEQQPHGEETGMYFTDFIYQLNKGLKIFVDNGTGDIIREVANSDSFKSLKSLELPSKSRMLNSTSDDTKISACRSAGVLATESTFRDICADFGITRRIIELLQNESIYVRRQAVLTLSILIKNHETNLGLALSNKVTSLAIKLLQDTDHDLISGALSVLVTLAKDDQESVSAKYVNYVFTIQN